MNGIFINEVLMMNYRKKLGEDCHKLVHLPS